MRNLIITALFAILGTPVLAQSSTQPIDSVEVNANGIVGIWKFGVPEWAGRSIGASSVQWGPMRDAFCRIEQEHRDLTISCSGAGYMNGTANIDGAHLHLSWGGMLVRIAIDGTLQSAKQFTGSWNLKLVGIDHNDPIVSNGAKLTLSTDTPDKAGKSGLLARLLDEMAQGAPAEPADTHTNDVQFLKPNALRQLGAVQAIVYLGEDLKPGIIKPNAPEPNPADFFSYYDVEFANGPRICTLHQREDGALDGFRCF